MKLPQELAGARIVSEDVARNVLVPCLVIALLVNVADYDDTIDDDRWR